MKAKKPPPYDTDQRVYLKKWEKKFPWISQSLLGENRALCTWCNKDLDVHGSGLRKHENSAKHRQRAISMSSSSIAGKQHVLISIEKPLHPVSESDKDVTSRDDDLAAEKITTVFELDDLSAEVAVDEPHGETVDEVGLNVSLPVSGHILKDMEVFTENVTLDKCSVTEPELPDAQICKLYAGSEIYSYHQDALAACFHTGLGHDAVWRCQGASFKVHKFVLAAFSPHFKDLLPGDESVAMIQTPDLSSDLVKCMLCLVYTGSVSLDSNLLQELNQALKLIGFCGKDLTAIPYQMSSEMTTIALGYNPSTSLTREPGMSHNEDEIVYREEEVDFSDDFGDLKEENFIELKIENKENEDFQHLEQKFDRLRYEEQNRNGKSRKSNFQVTKYKNLSTSDRPTVIEIGSQNRKRIRTDKESRVTYAIHRKDRGAISRQLAIDLFDDPLAAEEVKVITVCPICFKCFDDRDKMKEHRLQEHLTTGDKGSSHNQSSLILGSNKFECDKCKQVLELKHLVFFVKHYKYCGIDDEKANEVLKTSDPGEKYVKQHITEKKNSRYLDVLYVLGKKKLKEMSRMLLGRVCDAVWGCRKCYQPFDSEISLTNHVNNAHAGKFEHGPCYDPEAKMYTCSNCKIYKTKKSVLYFIYHLSRCNVQEQGVLPIDEEEDIDEDTNDNFLDPWGIVHKPLKIESDRSKWICESIFGEVYPMLYPCHICYAVFKLEDSLREHFRITHPGLQNYPEHGTCFDVDRGCFTCPTCKRQVCKKQKSSIFFAYHMRKCEGKLLPVDRRCPDCSQSFNVYREYQIHVHTKCATSNFICHICRMELKTWNSLKCHVMYSHSQLRPYPCKVCSKSFKRGPDLEHHMKLHLGSLDWSCEKCGKAFPVKKALKNHMKVHLSEAEKPHVCHICGNRFVRKTFLVNHLTTHSTFRGFSCEVCNAQVKTKVTLQLHRKKVHRLFTPIPDTCILQPDPNLISNLKVPKTMNKNIQQQQPFHILDGVVTMPGDKEQFQILDSMTAGKQHLSVEQLDSMTAGKQHLSVEQLDSMTAGKQHMSVEQLDSMTAGKQHLSVEQLHMLDNVVGVTTAVPESLQVKEEVLPVLGEELELA